MVWRLDRLGRSLKDLIAWVAWLEQEGIGLRSLHEALDTTTPSGKLTFHIFGALAEFERQLIQERTQAGLRVARARGRLGGRPEGAPGGQTAAGGAALPGEKDGGEAHLRADGDLQTDPLCLCAADAIVLIGRVPLYGANQRHYVMQFTPCGPSFSLRPLRPMRHALLTRGKYTRNVLPWPTVVSTRTNPPA